MDRTQIARMVLAGFEAGSVDAVGLFLAEDALCTGLMPHPLGKAAYLRVFRALLAGLPNWKFNPDDWQEHGNRVGVDIAVRATQTAVLPPVLPGLPPVLATGRHVALPLEHLEFFFRGDKIVRIDLISGPGGGVSGVLSQLGIEAPLAV